MVSWDDRALRATPGGAQTRSKRASSFSWAPITLVRGAGCHVWDTDGKRYIDWIAGLAAISLGYCHSAVDAAVERQLRHGTSFSLASTIEIETAEAFGEALGAEQVRFVKTGSEGTEGAMRIARLATQRDLIVSVGYHGWHTAHDAAAKSHPGVPWGYAMHVREWPWGDTLPGFNEPVAAVLVEPCRDYTPPAGYLAGLREWCTRHNTLLIFDEIVTGFRWALRGGSEFFGVEPDLRVYGKGMANGLPLAAIVGSRALMEHAAYVSGTFGGEALSLAAALATLDVYRTEPVVKRLWAIGGLLSDAFNDLHLPNLKMTGYAVHPRVEGPTRDAFLANLAAEGVLMHPKGFNVTYSHDEQAVAETIDACRRAAERM